MSRDNWERLVAAVVKREQIWQLCHDHSRSPSTSSISSSDSSEQILNLESNSVFPPPQISLSKLSVSQVNTGQPAMVSMEAQNLPRPPKGQSNRKLANSELPSGRKVGRKTTTHMQSRLWPWEAFWNRAKPSSNKSDLLLSGTGGGAVKAPDSASTQDGRTPALKGIVVDKSVEFSYEELANATNDFSIANNIGECEFGSVYYAELRGEKAAIKKMDMQGSMQFLAELKVLTHVCHSNLVRLIGYCVEGSLFVVYEYTENGNLSEHLRDSGRQPLPWSTRIQIALDSASGLEYIHEHSIPVCIHRDIKPANILIDKNFHGKIGNFGLAKLTEHGSGTILRPVGTFGYMPPEYAQYGDVSPKIDVYAFGVVMYELISAKEAIVKENRSAPKSLVALFEKVLSKPDPSEDLKKLVDPRLGDSYPLESVLKLAQMARACTHENPQIRPSTRSIVGALMYLLSSTDS